MIEKRNIVYSAKEPKNSYDLWFTGQVIKFYKEGEWITIVGCPNIDEFIKRMPLADKNTVGFIKIGEGFIREEDGTISVDFPELPIADKENLGIVSIGDNINVEEGRISVNNASTENKGVISVGENINIDEESKISVNTADIEQKGIVSIGENINVNNGEISVNTASNEQKGVVTSGENTSIEDGKLNVKTATKEQKGVVEIGNNIDIEDGKISVHTATKEDRGVIQLGEGLNSLNGIVFVDEATKDKKGILKPNSDFSIENGVLSLSDTIKDAPNGFATLDEEGKIKAIQLPSYVDDVLEYDSIDNFPEIGEKSKIYVDTTTDLTYRWSGTQYSEISKSIALGETENTAYSGKKGKELENRFNTFKYSIENSILTIYLTQDIDFNSQTPGSGLKILLPENLEPADFENVSIIKFIRINNNPIYFTKIATDYDPDTNLVSCNHYSCNDTTYNRKIYIPERVNNKGIFLTIQPNLTINNLYETCYVEISDKKNLLNYNPYSVNVYNNHIIGFNNGFIVGIKHTNDYEMYKGYFPHNNYIHNLPERDIYKVKVKFYANAIETDIIDDLEFNIPDNIDLNQIQGPFMFNLDLSEMNFDEEDYDNYAVLKYNNNNEDGDIVIKEIRIPLKTIDENFYIYTTIINNIKYELKINFNDKIGNCTITDINNTKIIELNSDDFQTLITDKCLYISDVPSLSSNIETLELRFPYYSAILKVKQDLVDNIVLEGNFYIPDYNLFTEENTPPSYNKTIIVGVYSEDSLSLQIFNNDFLTKDELNYQVNNIFNNDVLLYSTYLEKVNSLLTSNSIYQYIENGALTLEGAQTLLYSNIFLLKALKYLFTKKTNNDTVTQDL